MSVSKPTLQPELNAAYYRRRAQVCLNEAAEMPDRYLRRQMIQISQGYSRLAEQAEAWERDHPEGGPS